MKTAVILFNLGGPDRQESVRPFLFNLFKDPAIIRLPLLFRYMIAWIISTRRTKKAQHIYSLMGGGSPIVAETNKQVEQLEKILNHNTQDYRVFQCMRYWHPMTEEVVQAVKRYAPDKIILLPLYPQFSTTTTESSIKEWDKVAAKNNLNIPTSKICCYPNNSAFSKAYADLLLAALQSIKNTDNVKIIFSAHGLPQKVIDAGDPYQWQVEQSVAAILRAAGIESLDSVIAYQSRVGPMKWIEPYTEAEIIKAAKSQKHIVILPVAFVSEHSETLVELDIEYKQLAIENGATGYTRVAALGDNHTFITGLADLVEVAVASAEGICNPRICHKQYTCCINTKKA